MLARMKIDPRFRLPFALLAILFSACGSAGSRHSAAAAAPFVASEVLASAKNDIDAANAAWLPGLRNRDAAAITAAYADDAIFIAPDGTVTRGRAAITAMYAARFPKLREILGGDVVQDGTAVISASLIYEWGHAWLEVAPERAGDKPVRGGGAYLTVWQRSAGGHWNITRNLAL